MKIIIIGTGNVANVLGRLLLNAGHHIVQVYGRTEHSARDLAKRLNTSFCTEWNRIERGADIYLVALSDGFLHNLHHHLQLKNELVVHTAGSVSKEVLQNISSNYGVLYPLQSLHADREVDLHIPFMIDANNEKAIESITLIGSSVSEEVSLANDEQRLKFHLAAVLVNNFPNHLYALAENYCKENGLSFKHLLPLINETVLRIKDHSPANVQTGPAVRHDEITIKKHLELLDGRPMTKELYRELSESIQHFYKK